MVILMASLCLNYQFINEIGKNKTKHDIFIENIAKNTCARVYNSCLSKLIKKEERNYWAICGKEI